MEYTGERLIPGMRGLELLELEHRGRYELAARMSKGRTVLDLGAGAGYGAACVGEVASRVVGVDLSEEAVEFARGAYPRPHVEYAVLDVTSPEAGDALRSLSPDGFDLVLCFELIEHLDAPRTLLELIRSVLRPGGILLVSTPNSQRPHRATERNNPFHVIEYDHHEFVGLLKQQFSYVSVLSQTVHLATRIVPDRRSPPLIGTWPEEESWPTKYFLAVCSDRELDEELSGLLLVTSDDHLTMLQNRLTELRRTASGRAETLKALQEFAETIQSVPSSDQTEALAPALDDVRHMTRKTLEAIRNLLGPEAETRREERREVETLRNQIEDQNERIHALTRQLDERTASGEALGRRVAADRGRLEAQTAEIDALRASLDNALKKIEALTSSPEPTTTRDGEFLALFAQMVARLDTTVGILETEKRRLLERNKEMATSEGQPHTSSSPAPPPRQELTEDHPTLVQRQRGLIRSLANEFHHVLTSKRWRVAMALVRLRNLVTRRREGNPLVAHLHSHFKIAGIPVPPEIRWPGSRRRRRPKTYADLVLRPPRSGTDLVPLSDAQRDAWQERLASRSAEDLVTVVMPTWNRADVISDAIRSVMHQTYPKWELVVVDDGSEDDTEAVVRSLMAEEPRIRLLRASHRGVAAARDLGLDHARGEVVAYLDSDNTWDPNYLLFTVHALRDADLSCSYSVLRITDYDNNQAVSFRKKAFNFPDLLKNNYIDINVFAHRIELFRELGGFDHNLKRWVDWDLILRYTRIHRPAQIPIPLCDYRRHRQLAQVTSVEPTAYKFKVLNNHLIDWHRQESELTRRTPRHVTIVLLNYMRADLTEQCVRSLLQASTRRSYDILILDNSCDTSQRRRLGHLASEHEQVSMIVNYENYGFALGCNLGAAWAEGEYIIWLNNDTEVEEGWIDPLVEALEGDPEIGLVGPKLIYPDQTIQHAGLAFSPLSKIPFHIHQGAPRSAPYVNECRSFQALTGACLAIRARDFVRLRGFDPLYMNGCEDLDLCFRLRKELGKSVIYIPESVVVHHEGKSPGRSKKIGWNRQLFVDRWGTEVVPDDAELLARDGFSVTDYVKPGKEPPGPTAIYRPVLEASVPSRAVTGVEKPASSPAAPPATSRKSPSDRTEIGLVTIWYERGVSYVAKQLAEGLESAGPFRTHVLARWESDRFQNRGSIHHPRVVNGGDDPSPGATVAWARENRLGLVVFVEVHPNDWKRVEALQQAGIPVIGYEHPDVLRLGMFDRYGQLDGLLSSTFYTWRKLKERFPEKPCLLVPWGIPPHHARSGLNLPDSGRGRSLRFVHVAGWGGLNNRKNTDLLLRAFHEADLPETTLHLHTQAPMSKYGEECEEIVRRDPRIVLHEGTVDDIFEAYSGADMLLWPSKREGLGLPILEALACGLPVLTSDGYTMKEWPVIGEHALLCPAGPRQEAERVPRLAPLLDVDHDGLVRCLRQIADSPTDLTRMKEAVHRDRHQWLWTWQPTALSKQIGEFLEASGNSIGDERSFLPSHVLEFEDYRERSRQESGPGATTTSGPAPALGSRDARTVSYLFIAGCQRSGTTALMHLLNEDHRIVLGRERYKHCRDEITPAHFEEERFFNPTKDETNYRVPEFYDRLRDRWRSGKVRYVGDKVPMYYKNLPHLAKTFPDARILFLLRDLNGVASSYNARAQNPEDRVWKPSMDYRRAVEDWNESLARLVEFVDLEGSARIFIVKYEHFFSGDKHYLDALFSFLALSPSTSVIRTFTEMTREWTERTRRPSNLTEEMVNHLDSTRNRELENRCLDLCPSLRTRLRN